MWSNDPNIGYAWTAALVTNGLANPAYQHLLRWNGTEWDLEEWLELERERIEQVMELDFLTDRLLETETPGGERGVGAGLRRVDPVGEVAERYSDRIVITTDNPRSEDAQNIIVDILAGLSDADEATVIEDRAAAIAWAIEQAREVWPDAPDGPQRHDRTDDPDRDYGELGLGVSSVFKGGGQVFFSYDTLIGFENLTSHLFTLGGRIEF